MPDIRTFYVLTALAAAALIGVALYMQHGMGLEPCALCITQRAFVIAVGTVALLAALQNPRRTGRWVYTVLGLIASGLGAATAVRQLWLQSLPPDQVPACGPSLDYILGNFPLQEALSLLLRGDGNCAEVVWTFLGLSIPGWTLIAFIGFAVVFLWQALRRPL